MPETKIDKEMIKKVASLARLNLSEKEAKDFQGDLKDILKAFSKLDEINVDNVKGSFHAVQLKNFMREDKVENCLTQEEALSNTKHKKDGYFKGPRAV